MTPLKPDKMDHAHYVRLSMTATVPPGTTLDDVTDPGFWSNHAFRLKRGSLIEVLSEDNALDCELRVLDVGPTYANVRVLRNHSEAAAAPKQRDLPEDVEVNYGGKNDRWRVVHLGQVVKAGMETKEAAEKAADEYRSKFAA